MKTIKISLLFSVLLFLCSNNNTLGQAILSGGPGPTLVLKAGTSINNSFIPPDPTIFSGARLASAVINVNFVGAWPGQAMAAFSHAVDIWQHSITSVVPIDIDANWMSLPSNILGEAHASTMVANFGSTDARYKTDTWYAVALANKLSGTDQASGLSDIGADFNSSFTSFYFGTDGNAPNNQYDFVTVVLHEIAHGLGFFSTANYDQGFGSLAWTNNNFPDIFDWFITNSSNMRLTSFAPTGTALDTYLQSDDLFFDGNQTVSANGSKAKLYAPGSWEQGSSGSHFDQIVFEPTPSRLMVPAEPLGQGIHNAGPVGIGVLNDIGWDATLWIGIEDRIEVYGYPGGCCPFPIPQRVLQVGGTYGYQLVFSDEYPYGNYLTGPYQWDLELLHRNGRYTLAASTGNGSTSWNVNVTSLPSGYDWHRDINGRICAIISASATDDSYIVHHYELPVFIDYKPDPAYINLKNHCNSILVDENAKTSSVEPATPLENWAIGSKASVDIYTDWMDGLSSHPTDIEKITSEWLDWKDGQPRDAISQQIINNVIVNLTNCCNSVRVNFFSYAATSYYVLYRKVTDLTFLLVQVPSGELTQTISGLDEFSNYVFYVGAVNSLGGTLSDPIYRPACKAYNQNGDIVDKVTASPNPATGYIDLTLNDAEDRIVLVSVNQIDNPQVGKVVTSINPEMTLEVQLDELPSGWYAATVMATSNLYYSVKFFKN